MRGKISAGAIIVALLVIVSVVGVIMYVRSSRTHSPVSVNKLDHQALIYPGARTMANVTSPTGTGVLQLQTSDDMDKVANWYLVHLKPASRQRVSSMVTMTSGNVNVVILSDSGSTNIRITQTP